MGASRDAASPVRAVVVTPPVLSSGGIGRLVSYELAEWRKAPDISVTVLDSRGSRGAALSLVSLVRTLLAISWLKMRSQVDVLHINVSSRGSTARKSLVVAWGRVLRLPIVLHLHGSGYDDFFRGQPAYVRSLIRRVFARADVVIALGFIWRNFLVDDLLVDVSRVEVIANAVPGPGGWKQTVRREGEKLQILFCGNLGERKGAARLVQALALLADEVRPFVRLVIVGDGDRRTLESLGEKHGLGDQVNILGWVSAEEVSRLLALCHLMILPSRAENQPLSILEAMAHGVPVVASPVGAVPEIISDGKTGLLVAPDDIRGIAAAIENLWVEGRRLQMSQLARANWEAHYRIEEHAQKVASVWRRLT